MQRFNSKTLLFLAIIVLPSFSYGLEIFDSRLEFEGQRIYFKTDSTEFTKDAMEILQKQMNFLENNQSTFVIIEGHCDERGSTNYNYFLGLKRAGAVKQYLIQHGIDENRIEIVSYGETRPTDTKHNHIAWAKNRRVQFVIESD